MVFKNECTKFLDILTNLRKATIDREVQNAIELKHVPYKLDMESQRDKVIAQARDEADKEILAIQAKREQKIQKYRAETELAIAAHKENVIIAATEEVRKNYDNFILGVSKLVDNTNIND